MLKFVLQVKIHRRIVPNTCIFFSSSNTSHKPLQLNSTVKRGKVLGKQTAGKSSEYLIEVTVNELNATPSRVYFSIF